MAEKTELELIEEQIAERKARTAALVERREADDRIKAARAELARAEAEEFAAEKLAEIAATKGPRGVDWDALTVPDGRLVVLRAPARVKYEEWQATECSVAFEHLVPLVTSCLEFPTQAEFDRILTRYPGQLSSAAVIINRLGGAKVAARAGK